MMTSDQRDAKNSRLPVTERADGDQLPGLRLTKRDRQIVAAVYTHRALTSAQVEALLFPDSAYTRANRRLKKLFHHGYLDRFEQPQTLSAGRKPLVYVLDEKGVQLLMHWWDVGRDAIDWHPRHNEVGHTFLDHLLETNDVRVAIEVAADRQGWEVETWHNERALKSRQMKDYVQLTGPRGGKYKAAVVPDGYFALTTDEYRYHHFLEVDRATVTGQAKKWQRRDWARKVRAYREYVKSGQYEERYETTSLAVLTVTTGQRRLRNLKEITEDVAEEGPMDLVWFWFTTFAEATPDQILTEAIWYRAGDNQQHGLVSP